MGRAWIDYLSRSQFLLQRSHAAADVLFYGEEPAGPIPMVLRTVREKNDRMNPEAARKIRDLVGIGAMATSD